jgi:hypothetical protein
MTESLAPGALSLEDATLVSPPTSTPQAEPPEPEPEPEGVVDVQGKRMVDVGVLAAERRRVREATERNIREKELAPLQAKAQEADQLRQALADAQPYLQHLRQHPELLQPPKPTSLEDQVSDEDARTEARDLELYAADGQPDVTRAKRIIARRRQDATAAAQQATAAAVGPITSQTAQTYSRQNFVQAASRRTPDGHPLVDPKALAQLWASLPAELTQHAEVGELLLDAAIGKTVRTGGQVARADRPPLVSESPSGRAAPAFQMSDLTRTIAHAAGMTEKSFAERAKDYKPGELNVLGD